MRALLFHPNGKHLLSASDDKTIRVWDLASARCVRAFEAHTHFVTSLAWGPPVHADDDDDSSNVVGLIQEPLGEPQRYRAVVASGSVDQTVHIWLP